MKERTTQTTISGKTFDIIIDGSDPHDWSLANEADQPAFDAAWAQMATELRERVERRVA